LDKHSHRTIRHKAMDFLARREHSALELRQKLVQRFPDSDEIEAVLNKLIVGDLQSDQRFAESFFRLRVNGGFGPQRIRAEMRQRGLDDTLIDQEFQAQSVDWVASVKALCQKKYADVDLGEIKARAKALRYLQYKGHDFDVIHAALKDN
jgi:regulatory protein